MNEILAVFRSRSQAVDFNSRLRAGGAPCTLINTPKEANVGCGLSVRFAQNFLPSAKFIAKNGNYSAFFGFFAYTNRYGRIYFNRI